MNPDYFTATEAAAELAKAGLLTGVLSPSAEGLQLLAPAACATLPGGFLGAGLDSRSLRKDELFVALAGEQVDGRHFAAGALQAGHWVLLAPGEASLMAELTQTEVDASAGVFLCADPVAALACLAAAWRSSLPVRVVGVTGTNGKTTTKDLLRAALSGAGTVYATSGNLNNQLGLPLTLLGLRADHVFAVIEMGASAVGEIDFLAGLARPTVGVITNAAPAHLAEFGTLAQIIQGKGELLDHLPPDGTAVLNADSPGYGTWCTRATCAVQSHGTAEADHVWTWRPLSSGGELTLDGEVWHVPLPGQHNGANLAAAILAAQALGLAKGAIAAGLDDFAGSAHRGVLLTAGHWTILDDCYNANPHSMTAAAHAVADLPGDRQVVAVLGHMAEMGADSEAHHLTVGRQMATAGLDILLAVGEAAAPLAHGFMDAGRTGYVFADVNSAAEWLLARSADIDRILVKGSRSAAMEQILPLLSEGLNPTKETS